MIDTIDLKALHKNASQIWDNEDQPYVCWNILNEQNLSNNVARLEIVVILEVIITALGR